MLRNIFSLILGTGFSQLLNLILAPVLSRIYSPSDFGQLSLFLSIASTISVIGSYKYEQAILLPKDNSSAKNIFHLCLILIVLNTIILFLLVYPFVIICDYFHLLNNSYFMIGMLIPFGFFVNSLLQTTSLFLTRKKKFSLISYSRITQSSSINAYQYLSSFFKVSSVNLIFGQIIGSVIAIFFTFIFIKNDLKNIFSIKKKTILRILIRYKSFPKYNIFSTMINSLSLSIPIILLEYFYSSNVTGFFSMTFKLLIAPVSLIGRTSKNVYYEKASHLFREGKNIKSIFLKQTIILGSIIILPLILLFFYGEVIFVNLLGDNWVGLGEYVKAIIPLIFFIMMNGPSVANINILSLQKFQLKYEFLLFVGRVLAIFLGYLFFDNPITSIYYYTFVGVIMNAILIYKNYSILNHENSNTP